MVCCLCTTQINRTASLGATPPPEPGRRGDQTVAMADVRGVTELGWTRAFVLERMTGGEPALSTWGEPHVVGQRSG